MLSYAMGSDQFPPGASGKEGSAGPSAISKEPAFLPEVRSDVQKARDSICRPDLVAGDRAPRQTVAWRGARTIRRDRGAGDGGVGLSEPRQNRLPAADS